MDRIESLETLAPIAPIDNTQAATMRRTTPAVSDDFDFRSYFRSAGKAALLSAEEEKTLGWNIQNEACAASRDRLVRSNLRLVVCIARKYVGRGLGMPDLIAEGNLGLLRAVDRFDPAHGARFSTYASWWIKHAIRNGIRQTREMIHIPAHVLELSSQWQRETTRQQITSGNTMNAEEIATTMDFPPKLERKLLRTISRHVVGGTPSIPASAEQSLPDTRELAPDGRMMLQEELAAVHALLHASSTREATALRMRFGMDGNKPHTLSRIGDVLGISRESVRKLLVSALRTMGAGMASDQSRSRENTTRQCI